ncbi:hypothetical protein IPG41_00800 [Candidatus Peregrinibacteria bacterium]|nr:MAG: hypothetical protein IPG41_00800 [Candidatus Peregrinibacteria bacterium]
MAFKNLKIDLLSGTGTALILVLAIGVTYELYIYGIENMVYTNNYTTSVLLSDTLATGTGVAPLALAGLNWFICKSAIKKWRKFIRKILD